MIRRLVISCSVLSIFLLFNSVTDAQSQELNWAEKMFSELNVDFGVVARGSDTRHNLIIENLYEEDVSIVNVGTTCGCTAAKPDRKLLKTHEKATIEIEMDTRKFMHRKDSNVDVTLEFHGAKGTASKTIRVPITAYIRSDVVLTPGNVDFGAVDFGQPVERKISVEYAGRENWTIKGIRNGNSKLDAQVIETGRENGRVSYQLTVQLDGSAGIGTFQDKIYLLTDDANSPEVPVLVTGRISPDIEIVPGKLMLGSLASGEVKQFTVVIRGRKPFSIDKIVCDSHPDCFEVSVMSDAPKAVHVVPFRLTTPAETGEFNETFTVSVEGRAQPLTFSASGTIQSGT